MKIFDNVIVSNWIVYQSEYIEIVSETIEKRKTPIYHIYSKHSNDEIGIIKWYGAWRKYCFFPNEDTIWDKKCLEQMLKKDFLDHAVLVNVLMLSP